MPDLQAIGVENTTKAQWQQARGIDCSKQIRITKLSHMRYQHPDLMEITRFLKGTYPLELSLLLFTAPRLRYARRPEER